MDKELHRIAITGIIYNAEGKYLVTKRSLTKKAFPGKWTVPGGGISTDDYIETPPSFGDGQWYNVVEKTLRREILEEVNVEIEKPEYLLDLTFIRRDNVPVLVLSYMCRYASGEVTIDGDSADTIDFAWATFEELKSYDLIDGILEEIEMVDKILKSR
jgi:8-oxo-dGTP pyrophosphatase MutT (NUDIX family)